MHDVTLKCSRPVGRRHDQRRMVSTLKREVDTYNRLLPSLMPQQGKFALVKGDALAGVYDSYQDALTAGYEKFKLEPFLVKQVAPAQQVAFFTRDLAACQA